MSDRTEVPESGASTPWGLLAILTVINILNFVDRQLLPSFANSIKPELGLTDTQWGLLTGLFFIVFYAVAGLFMGMLADLTHRPRLIAAAIALWSLLTAASGAAKGFVSMAIPRALVGVGESALTPAAMSLLADRVPSSKLSLAVATYYLGVPIGAGASLLIAGFLGPTIGWRNCFYLLGGFGLILAVGMLFVRDPRPKPTRAKGLAFGTQMRILWGALKGSPALCAVIGANVALHFAVGAAAFDQLWFVQERGFKADQIAQITGGLIAVGGIAGIFAGGFIGDWWNKHMKSGRPMLLFWMFLILSPLGLLFRIVSPDSPFFFIGVFAGMFQLSATYGPVLATVQDLSPPTARATVTAFHILCANAIGLGIGITVTGILIDAFRAAGMDEPYSKGLLTMGLLSCLALPAFYFAGKWSRPHRGPCQSLPARQ
jgi:MFS transporter, Spinster family, sphingosine-1-phosphate transporter